MDTIKTDEQEVLETPVEETDEEDIFADETEETDEETTDETEDNSDNEAKEELAKIKKENEELVKKNKQLFERAKKNTPKTELSQQDLIVLMKADVHEDDIQEVVDYAKFKGTTVKQALNDTVMKSVIAERTEERTSAEATSVGSKNQSPTRASTSRLLSDAKKGIMPENDEDMGRLIDAQRGIKS